MVLNILLYIHVMKYYRTIMHMLLNKDNANLLGMVTCTCNPRRIVISDQLGLHNKVLPQTKERNGGGIPSTENMANLF